MSATERDFQAALAENEELARQRLAAEAAVERERLQRLFVEQQAAEAVAAFERERLAGYDRLRNCTLIRECGDLSLLDSHLSLGFRHASGSRRAVRATINLRLSTI